jgi:hypothetical protein
MKFCLGMFIINLLPPCCQFYAEDIPEATECEWKVIVAYFPGTPMEVSEDWNWFLDDICTNYNEDVDFFFVECFADDDTNICIVNPEDELITSFDISEYTGGFAGYIFLMKGADPLWCDYDQSYKVIEQADAYFYGVGE